MADSNHILHPWMLCHNYQCNWRFNGPFHVCQARWFWGDRIYGKRREFCKWESTDRLFYALSEFLGHKQYCTEYHVREEGFLWAQGWLGWRTNSSQVGQGRQLHIQSIWLFQAWKIIATPCRMKSTIIKLLPGGWLVLLGNGVAYPGSLLVSAVGKQGHQPWK